MGRLFWGCEDPRSGYRPGERVYLEIDWGRVVVFDPESGGAVEALTRAARQA